MPSIPHLPLASYDSRPAWETGTIDSLAADVKPGSLVPIGHWAKTYDRQTEWAAGTAADVVVGDTLALDGALVSNTAAGYDETNWGGATRWREVTQRIAPRGHLWQVGMQGYSVYAYDAYRYLEIRDAETAKVLWRTEFVPPYPANHIHIGHPDLMLHRDVIVALGGTRVDGQQYDWWQYSRMASSAPPGVDPGEITGYIQYKVGHYEIGTWTSAWLAHGVAAPEYGVCSLDVDIPVGTVATAEVRYSDDGGITATEWQAVVDGRMPGVSGTHVQARLTLEAYTGAASPVVRALTLIIGPAHRWTSPPIDVPRAAEVLMVASSQSSLDIGIEIKPGAEQWLFVAADMAYPYHVGWRSVGMIHRAPEWASVSVRLTLRKTKVDEESLERLDVWAPIVLPLYGKPRPELSPPQATTVTAYVTNSDPLIEATATLPGTTREQARHLRVSVPEGSSQDYALEIARRTLAAKSREQVSLVGRVPLTTRIGFGQLIPICIPYAGYTRERPYIARVQRIQHNVLASPPYTEISLGDYWPDDAETLARLLRGLR